MAIPTFDFDEAIAAHEEDCAQRQQLERLKRSTATIVDPDCSNMGRGCAIAPCTCKPQ